MKMKKNEDFNNKAPIIIIYKTCPIKYLSELSSLGPCK